MIFILADATTEDVTLKGWESVKEIITTEITPALIALFAIIVVFFVYACYYNKYIKKFREGLFKSIDEWIEKSYEQGIRAINEIYGYTEDDGKAVKKGKLDDFLLANRDPGILYKRLDYLNLEIGFRDELNTITESVLLSVCIALLISNSLGDFRNVVWVVLILLITVALHLHYNKQKIGSTPETKCHSLHEYERIRLLEKIETYSKTFAPYEIDEASKKHIREDDIPCNSEKVEG